MKQNVSLKTYLMTVCFILLITMASISWVLSNGSEIAIVEHSFIKGASYIIENDEGTIKAFSGTTGALSFSGSDLSTVLNNAMNSLTTDRTWKEKIVLKGEFEIDYNVDGQILVPDYTVLDFDGSLLKIEDDTEYLDDFGIIANLDNPCTDIEIRGLRFDENAGGASLGWGYVFWFSNCSNILFDNCWIDTSELGYELIFDGTGQTVVFQDCITHYLYMDSTIENTQVKNSYMNDTVLTFNGDYSSVTDCHFDIVDPEFFGQNCSMSDCVGTDITITAGGDYCNIDNIVAWYPNCNGMYIKADYCSVTGCSLIGPGQYGIRGWDGSGESCIFQGNRLQGWVIGLMHKGNNSVFLNNIFEDCSVKAISFTAGCNNVMGYNQFIENELAIEIDSDSINNTVRTNKFIGCTTIIDDSGTGTKYESNEGFVTENSGTTELSNDDWGSHGLEFEPTYVTLTIEETDANYFLQLKATNSTHFQIYLQFSNETACEVDKTINWYAEYQP